MFRVLGNAVVRTWPFLLVGWIALLGIVIASAPDLSEVVEDGEFAFLPEDAPSRQGEELFKRAWDESLSSRVVVVVRRESHADGLREVDKEFIETILKPRLEQIASEHGIETASGDSESGQSEHSVVRTFSDPSIGRLLISEDNQASLVIVELPTEFLDARNTPLIDRIERLIGRNGELHRQGLVPPGLDLATSGEATVGRDMIRAAKESVKATEFWTVLLVILLLIAIYRAPILALIPLLTVAIATKLSLGILALLAEAGIIGLFNGIETYVTVLSYGAGVDYCLFLIARHKEELDDGSDFDESVENSLAKVGAALTASAGTVMCGIGMMVFAEFGKFRQAGVGITLGLFIVLCAALTFAPALLRLTGRWAYWPRIPSERLSATAGWISAASPLGRLLERNLIQVGWTRIGQALLRRPGQIWLASIAVMLPFAVIGIVFYDFLSYGLLSELPQNKPSVIGAKAVQQHFPAGMAGPVTILIRDPYLDFTSPEGIEIVQEVSAKLESRQEELELADVQSIANPLGITPAAQRGRPESPLARGAVERIIRERAMSHYVSTEGDDATHVTRIDLVFQDDPFSRDSIREFERLRQIVEDALPERMNHPRAAHIGVRFDDSGEPRIGAVEPGSPADHAGLQVGDRFRVVNGTPIQDEADLRAALDRAPEGQESRIVVESPQEGSTPQERGVALEPARHWRRPNATEIFAIGPTASMRDLKTVTDRDQIRIDVLVLTGVFFILVVLLRRPAISLYLILSVLFSYLVTLGVTFAVFWLLSSGPDGFAGLDWKVPMFLFTILIAVGEDYNIFLMTRIEEEQARHGMVNGVIVALQRTGSIISSCGIIMAGTFSSLLAGSLVGMHQLGFALAFGVLLDTFVVRPILVPAYLILLYRGRFGSFGKFLDAHRPARAETPSPIEVGTDA